MDGVPRPEPQLLPLWGGRQQPREEEDFVSRLQAQARRAEDVTNRDIKRRVVRHASVVAYSILSTPVASAKG